MRTLGVDWGANKVRFCGLEAHGGAQPRVTAQEYPLPAPGAFRPARGPALADAFLAAAAAFRSEGGAAPFDRVLVGTSHFFNEPDFATALARTLTVLTRAFPREDARLVAVDGRGYTVAEAGALPPASAVRFLDTTFRGVAHLAAATVVDGLAVDCGSQSTDVVGVRGGVVEPGAIADPDGFARARIRNGRFLWLGVLSTPLDYLAPEVELDGLRQPLLPGLADTGVLASLLDLVPVADLLPYALAQRVLPPEQALVVLAQACGSDVPTLGEGPLRRLARDLADRFEAQVARAAARVLEDLGVAGGEARAVVGGLGAPVAVRALARAGLRPDRVVDFRSLVPESLVNFASCHGLAVQAFAELAGQPA